jgi:hypothetical protein
MLAGFGIDAAVSEAQALDGTITHNVGLNDLCHIRESDVAVPDSLGIHDHIRTVFALVEASGLVGADGVFQPAQSQLRLESPLEFGGAGWITASTRMPVGTLVAAYEDVLCEFSHKGRCYQILSNDPAALETTKTGRTQRPADDRNLN